MTPCFKSEDGSLSEGRARVRPVQMRPTNIFGEERRAAEGITVVSRFIRSLKFWSAVGSAAQPACSIGPTLIRMLWNLKCRLPPSELCLLGPSKCCRINAGVPSIKISAPCRHALTISQWPFARWTAGSRGEASLVLLQVDVFGKGQVRPRFEHEPVLRFDVAVRS